MLSRRFAKFWPMNTVQRHAFELQLSSLQKLASKDADLSGCMLSACSAHDAPKEAQMAVIQFLVDSGVSVNETDKNGVTPLHRAVRFRSLAAVDCLLAAGANVHAADRKTRSTALHRAVTNTGAPNTAGKSNVAAGIVRLLLSHGADSSAKNKMGKTPLDYRVGPAVADALRLGESEQ